MKKAWNKGIKLSEIPKYSKMGFQKGHEYFVGSEKTQFQKGHNLRVGMQHSEISNEKNRQSHLGKKLGAENASWKGGITPLMNKLKRLSKYKDWQTNIMKRDNFTCRKCKKRGGYLTPHHLTSLSFLAQIFKIRNVKNAKECLGLWNVRNGVTLCKNCHSKTSNFGWRAVEKPRDRFVYLTIGLFLALMFINPVQVNGATFGYTSVGANQNNSSGDFLLGSKFAAPEDGTVTSISVRNGSGANDDGPEAYAIYLFDSGDGTHDLLANTDGFTPVTDTWNTASITTGDADISSGVDYMLVIHSEETQHKYDTGFNNSYEEGAAYPGSGFPSVFTDNFAGGNQFSIYATYTTGGEPEPTPPTQDVIWFQ